MAQDSVSFQLVTSKFYKLKKEICTSHNLITKRSLKQILFDMFGYFTTCVC